MKNLITVFLMLLTCCQKQSEGVIVVSGVKLSTGPVLVLVSSGKSQDIIVVDNKLTNYGNLRGFVDPVIMDIDGNNIELKWGYYYGFADDQMSVMELSKLKGDDRIILQEINR